MSKSRNWLIKLLGSPKRKYLRFARKNILNAGTIEQRFTWVYNTKHWGNEESISGPGSTLKYTENLRKNLPSLFRQYEILSVLDAPCGDFNWMKEVVRSTEVSYFGMDIVQKLVEENQTRYRADNINFGHGDITQSELPASDLMICRDCLFHLSYDDIYRFLKNFLRSDIKFLLTTTHVNYAGDFENEDIKSSDFRKIDLFLPPFALPEPLRAIDDWIDPYPPRQMCLWSKQQIADALNIPECEFQQSVFNS